MYKRNIIILYHFASLSKRVRKTTSRTVNGIALEIYNNVPWYLPHLHVRYYHHRQDENTFIFEQFKNIGPHTRLWDLWLRACTHAHVKDNSHVYNVCMCVCVCVCGLGFGCEEPKYLNNIILILLLSRFSPRSIHPHPVFVKNAFPLRVNDNYNANIRHVIL